MESDLAGLQGKRTVVLVTDGEETCEGDPEQVLRGLRERGFDIRVNVVGLAIDNPALEQQFKSWADIGGGSYFDAGDSESLRVAVAAALRVPFQVFDQAGSLVAEGEVDGEPVELEPGVYDVRVEASTVVVFESVEVAEEPV